MRYLFIDCETSGLPKDNAAPYTDLDNWPHLLSVGMVLANEYGNVIGGRYMVRKNETHFENGAVNINGLTNEARQSGYTIWDIMEIVKNDLYAADLIIAHNVEFDKGVIFCEIARMKKLAGFIKTPWFCTKENVGDITGEPASAKQRRYRPNVEHRLLSLNDLHRFLFGKNARNEGEIHNALTDAQTVCKCFFEMKKQNIINA